MEKIDYSKRYQIEHNGIKYIFNPMAFGVGAWQILTAKGKAGQYATKKIQKELNEKVFSRKELPNVIERLKNASNIERRKLTNEAIAWLQLKIKGLKGNIRNIPGSVKSYKIIQGNLYFFVYDAKGKDELPYWDAFPLIILLEKYNNGFLGLNLHYLPPEYRAIFLNKLMDDNKSLVKNSGEILKLAINYEKVKSSKIKGYRSCLKRYLADSSYLKSDLVLLEPHEWMMAINLPNENFQKAKKQTVWNDTRKRNNL